MTLAPMDINSENDITPEVARQLRLASGLTQRKFWEGVGSNQASGHWFEVGKRKSIPRPIRILIFLRHVAKFDFDVGTPEGAAAAIEVGHDLALKIAARRADAEAKAAARRAKELAKVASRKAA